LGSDAGVGSTRLVGIDLGGTKIEGVVLDEGQQVVFRDRLPTEAWLGYEHILRRVGEVAALCGSHAPGVEVIGLGSPGSVSTRTGGMKNCNTTCLNGRFLKDDLEQQLGLRVLLENDANLFALAEANAGAGQGAELVFGVILGTGVGGGFVHRGSLLRGPQHLAGEWGHHSIDPGGPECYCGQRGCVEAILAGPALERRYVQETGDHAAMPAILAAYRRGDAAAVDVMRTFLDRFGRALANVINIIDPDIVVLGGGLSNIDELYSEGRTAVARYVFNDELRTPIVRHRLGDSAGVIGAALLTAPAAPRPFRDEPAPGAARPSPPPTAVRRSRPGR
jgi:fructokinase